MIEYGIKDEYNYLILDYLEISIAEYLEMHNKSIESIKIVVKGMIDSVKTMHGIGLLHSDIKV